MQKKFKCLYRGEEAGKDYQNVSQEGWERGENKRMKRENKINKEIRWRERYRFAVDIKGNMMMEVDIRGNGEDKCGYMR